MLNLESFSFDVVTIDSQGQEIHRLSHQAQFFVENLSNGISLEMVSIPGGNFQMGSLETESDRYPNESPQHQVNISPFFLSKTPITQAQWRTIASLPQINRSLNPEPSSFKGDNLPVECVSWYDAVEFCQRLLSKTGHLYRLPSEAEWEYACRAGTTTPFHFGPTMTSDLANYFSNYAYGSGPTRDYRQQTTAVGSLEVANAFGLYDLHGNIAEWCHDSWHENYSGAPADGSAWESEEEKRRVLRGGSWVNNPRCCRSAFRGYLGATRTSKGCGFRVALSLTGLRQNLV